MTKKNTTRPAHQLEQRQLAYASEKMSEAVQILATHPEEIRVRLMYATPALALVPAEALPTPFAEQYQAIYDALTKYKPDPRFTWTPERPYGITPAGETLHRIRKKTAVEIARRIVSLACQLDYALEPA